MSRRFITFAAAILMAVPVAVFSSKSSGQETTTSEESKAKVKKIPVPYMRASSGKDMYMAYCASCHGKDGKGDGPAASALKSAPTDLTQLAASNRGKFPENHVSQTIRGDYGTTSHGSKDMPVWGFDLRVNGNDERWFDAIAYSQLDEVYRVAATVGTVLNIDIGASKRSLAQIDSGCVVGLTG